MILGIPAYTVMRVFAREFFYGYKAVQKITSSLATEDSPDDKKISNVFLDESRLATSGTVIKKESNTKPQE
jgi:hypothetical protein